MALPIPQVIKDHPFITIGGLIGVVVIVMLVSGGGSAASDEYAVSNDADALSQLGAQLNAQMAGISASKEVALNNNATQVTLANIGAEAAKFAADRSFQLESERLATIERTTTQQSTLAADIRNRELRLQAKIANRTLLSQERQTNAVLQSNAQLAELAARPKGLFSLIFG